MGFKELYDIYQWGSSINSFDERTKFGCDVEEKTKALSSKVEMWGSSNATTLHPRSMNPKQFLSF